MLYFISIVVLQNSILKINYKKIIKKQKYHDLKYVRKVRKKNLKFRQEYIANIANSTDYDVLRQVEFKVFGIMCEYGNFIEKEILDRNKIIDAINKQVELINSTGRSKLMQQFRAEENKNATEELKLKISRIEDESKEIKKFLEELEENNYQFLQQVAMKKKQLFKGLLSARIQQFSQFTADESTVGDQCAICMGDIEIGRKMMRLDCDGQHTFCQVCIEGWFAEHNTCPICMHAFE